MKTVTPAIAIVGLTSLILAMASAIALSQHVRRGSVAEIRANEVETDWETGVTQMSGDCVVTIRGDYQATMTATALLLKTDMAKVQVLSFEAKGPVHFEILTKPVNGKRSKIIADCTDTATFSEQTMLVVLKGNAHAEITGVPQVESVESAKYDGESITIDLKNHKIKLKQAHLSVEMAPAPAESGPEGNQ